MAVWAPAELTNDASWGGRPKVIAPIGLEVAGNRPAALLTTKMELGPAPKAEKLSGLRCVANELWPGNSNPGDCPADGSLDGL